MESFTQYEIRGMLQELVDAQDSPFVEDGLLAIPEEHVFDGLKEACDIEELKGRYTLPNRDLLSTLGDEVGYVPFASEGGYVCQQSRDPFLDVDMKKRSIAFSYCGYTFNIEVMSKCDNDEVFNKFVMEVLTRFDTHIVTAYPPKFTKE